MTSVSTLMATESFRPQYFRSNKLFGDTTKIFVFVFLYSFEKELVGGAEKTHNPQIPE
jgi:hypothetical protein